MSTCGNALFEMRYSYVQKGDPITANRLCHNLAIISQIAARIGRLLLICQRIGERDYENWRHDLDILTIDWFSGLYVDSKYKYDEFKQDYNERILCVEKYILELSIDGSLYWKNNKRTTWILKFWKTVCDMTKLSTNQPNSTT